jgi:uronate dehydrogenase
MADARHPGRLLITGAAGRLGTVVRRGLGAKWQHLRLTDVRRIDETDPRAEVMLCDLRDANAVARLVAGVEAIVHFAGYPREAPWPQILENNLVPATLLWEAARATGVKRIVFASSNHAVGFNRRDDRSDPSHRARPDSRYGVAHAFSELMASLYADKFGIAAFAMRVGSMTPEPTDARMLATWLSPGDLVRLTEVGLTADYRFEIVYGISRNRLAWWDNARAFELGYAPADSADPWIPALVKEALGDPLADALQGGRYVLADDF